MQENFAPHRFDHRYAASLRSRTSKRTFSGTRRPARADRTGMKKSWLPRPAPSPDAPCLGWGLGASPAIGCSPSPWVEVCQSAGAVAASVPRPVPPKVPRYCRRAATAGISAAEVGLETGASAPRLLACRRGKVAKKIQLNLRLDVDSAAGGPPRERFGPRGPLSLLPNRSPRPKIGSCHNYDRLSGHP